MKETVHCGVLYHPFMETHKFAFLGALLSEKLLLHVDLRHSHCDHCGITC